MRSTTLYTTTILIIGPGLTFALDTFAPSLCFYPTSPCGTPSTTYVCCTDLEPNGCCTNNAIGGSYCHSLGGQNLSPHHTVSFFAAQNCARRYFGSCTTGSLDEEESYSEEWVFPGYRATLGQDGVDGTLMECSMRLEAGEDGPAGSSDSEREEGANSSSSSGGSSSGRHQGLFMASPQRQRQGGGSARGGTRPAADGNGAVRNGNGNGTHRNKTRAPPSAIWAGDENESGPSRSEGRPAWNRNGNANAVRSAANGNGNGNGAGPSRNGARPAANGNSLASRPGAPAIPNANPPFAVQAPPSNDPLSPGTPPPSANAATAAPVCRNPDTVSYIDANRVRKNLKFQPEKAIAVLRLIDQGRWDELEEFRV